MPEPVDLALALAPLGVYVFPVAPGTKKPALKSPGDGQGGLNEATIDPDTIRAMWERAPGSLVGVNAGRSGLVLLDIDVRPEEGKNGYEALSAYGHDVKPTFSYPTSRGGSHNWYRADNAEQLKSMAPYWVDGTPLVGVDRKAGGGFGVWRGPVPRSRKAFKKVPAWFTEHPRNESELTDTGVSAWRAAMYPGSASKAVKKAAKQVTPEGLDHGTVQPLITGMVKHARTDHDLAMIDAAAERYSRNYPECAADWDKLFAGSVRRFGVPPTTLEWDKARDAPSEPARVKPVALAECDDTFIAWLGLEYDLGALHAMLAIAVGERLDGDPAWGLLLSGSGFTKTETVTAVGGANARIVSSIASEGALLSATSQGERSKDATGGLLREIGSRGTLIIKDVTTILSMDRTARAQVLAALREVYDGRWTRNVGTDGGRSLEWTGRLVLIGAVTTAWDRAHEVVASMGDRFVLVRMDSSKGRIAAGRKAISNTGSEVTMRAELAEAAAGVLAGADLSADGPDDHETAHILAAADVVTQARTAVDMDYRGNVVDSHAPEAPTRFAKQLAQVFRGAVAIGLDREGALALAIRVARDSMPPLRLEILEDVATHKRTPLREVIKRVDKPRSTVDRQLQSLHLLNLLTVDEETTITPFTQRETTTWLYSLAEGVDISSLTIPNRTINP